MNTNDLRGVCLEVRDEVFPNVRVIPHGVDCFQYKLLGNAEQRQKLRNEKSSGWIKAEDIVLINVNANQRRKDTARSLEILARLHQLGHKEFKLIMWMSNSSAGDEQTTLENIGRQLGLRRGVEWDHMSDYFQGNLAGLPEDELNEFYSVSCLARASAVALRRSAQYSARSCSCNSS